MLLNYEIRFWKQKALRAQQQRDRAEAGQREAEELTKKYKAIPQCVLDKFLIEAKERELIDVKQSASVHMSSIGLTNFCRLSSQADLLDSIDDKINHWKKVITNYRLYLQSDEEVEESDEN